MASFTDNMGRTWVVSVDVSTLKRIKRTMDFDLLSAIGKPEAFERMYTDPIFLCDLLWVLCSDAAEKANVTDEDFGRGLAGDALDQAVDALVEALSDFFPNARRREMLKREMARNRQRESRVLDMTEKKLEEIDRAADELIERRVNESGERFIKSLERSASTPDLSLSEN